MSIVAQTSTTQQSAKKWHDQTVADLLSSTANHQLMTLHLGISDIIVEFNHPPPCRCSFFFDDDEDVIIACVPDMASAEHAARRSVQSTSQGVSTNSNNEYGRKIGSAKKKSTITSVFFGNDEDDVAACAPDVTGT